MRRETFEELAQAYGGDIVRWPANLREEAALLAAADPEFARAVLAQEAGLDAVLDALPRPQASAALYDRIFAEAPVPRRAPRWRAWLAPAGLSAVLASVAAAGLIVGVQLSAQSTPSEPSAVSVADLDVSYVAEVG